MNFCPVIAYCKNTKHCQECSGDISKAEHDAGVLPLLYLPLDRHCPSHPHDVKQYKQKLQRKAMRNEKDTRTELIRATKGSGALNGDGDSRIGDGAWGIDDKLQSLSSKQITIRTCDIEKASTQRCVIVITNAQGDKYVVAKLEDFAGAASALAEAVDRYTA